jgi:hypothetical protein
MYSSPEKMEPPAIVSEISEIHQELQGKFARIHVLSQALYHRVRRAPPDDNTSIYLQYANAWIRFSGMANQGATRTAHMSKVLRRLTPAPAENQVATKLPVKTEVKASESPVESLINMYGEELDGFDVPEETASSREAED